MHVYVCYQDYEEIAVPIIDCKFSAVADFDMLMIWLHFEQNWFWDNATV